MVLNNRKVMGLLLLAGLVVVGAAAVFLLSGRYDMAADTPHTRVVYRLLTTLRERSVAHHAQDIVAPPLEDPALISAGAGNYEAMCSTCHLAPGERGSELSRGLYPAPPRLDDPRGGHSPAQDFWIIKHGIKASGMPAWGRSMDDKYVWGLVAFLQKLPALTPEQYERMVEESPGHHHGGGEGETSAMPESPHHHHHDHGHEHEQE